MKIRSPRKSTLRWRASWIILPGLILSTAFAWSANDEKADKKLLLQQQFVSQIQPTLQKFCYPCHNSSKISGGINLADFKTTLSLQKDQETWRKVVTQLRARSMPPSGSPSPDVTLRETLTNWLHTTLETVDTAVVPKNPGRILV